MRFIRGTHRSSGARRHSQVLRYCIKFSFIVLPHWSNGKPLKDCSPEALLRYSIILEFSSFVWMQPAHCMHLQANLGKLRFSRMWIWNADSSTVCGFSPPFCGVLSSCTEFFLRFSWCSDDTSFELMEYYVWIDTLNFVFRFWLTYGIIVGPIKTTITVCCV